MVVIALLGMLYINWRDGIMKKKFLAIILGLLIVIPIVFGFGMGVINNMDFGQVYRGQTVIKDFQVWPMDSSCQPYTDVTCDKKFLVKIENRNPVDNNLFFAKEVVMPANQYTKVPITLKVKRRTRVGNYSSELCAIAISDAETGVGISVGACTKVKYEVVRRQNKFSTFFTHQKHKNRFW